jgi:hypothetical protein
MAARQARRKACVFRANFGLQGIIYSGSRKTFILKTQ